jgi:hypothetical protein
MNIIVEILFQGQAYKCSLEELQLLHILLSLPKANSV